MSHELSPKDRPEIISLHSSLRELISSLRMFLDTENYNYLERAYSIKEKIKTRMRIEWLSGFDDLDRNITAIHNVWRENGGVVKDFVHGRLLDQAVYSLVRANIMATGLEFKMKRMRKG